jgi:chromosome segregation ATPase
MAGQAHVGSIAALDDFRSKLLVYLSKAQRVLDDASHDVVGTRIWLQTDRQLYWKRELRRREHALAQAEQELMSARLSEAQGAIQDRRLMVQRARRALEEAQDKLRGVKGWLGRYDSEVESELKAAQQLRQILSGDMRKAVAFLESAGETLSDYAGMSPTPLETPGTGNSGAGPDDDGEAKP